MSSTRSAGVSENDEQSKVYELHPGYEDDEVMRNVCFSADNRLIGSGSLGGIAMVHRFDPVANSCNLLHKFYMPRRQQAATKSGEGCDSDHGNFGRPAVSAVGFVSNEEFITIAYSELWDPDNILYLWDLPSGRLVRRFKVGVGAVSSPVINGRFVRLMSLGEFVVFASADELTALEKASTGKCQLGTWDMSSGELINSLEYELGANLGSPMFSGKFISTATDKFTVQSISSDRVEQILSVDTVGDDNMFRDLRFFERLNILIGVCGQLVLVAQIDETGGMVRKIISKLPDYDRRRRRGTIVTRTREDGAVEVITCQAGETQGCCMFTVYSCYNYQDPDRLEWRSRSVKASVSPSLEDRFHGQLYMSGCNSSGEYLSITDDAGHIYIVDLHHEDRLRMMAIMVGVPRFATDIWKRIKFYLF